MKKLRIYVARYWQVALAGIGITSLATIFYAYGVNSFLPGLSAAEEQTIMQTQSLHALASNPLWLPHKLLMYLLQKLSVESTGLRLTGTILALLALYSFYTVTRRFYSTRVSVLTTILFGSSASFLTIARIATPAIHMTSWLMCIALALWFRHSHKKRFAPFIFFASCSLLLYTPGTLWFFALLCVWFWRDIPKLFKHLSKTWLAVGALLGIAAFSPLVYSFIKEPTLVKSWLLLPSTYNFADSLQALRQVPAAFLYRSDITPGYNLGKLPLLDAFSGTMLLLGLYAYRKKLSLQRTMIYIFAFACSTVLSVLNNNQLYLFFFLPFMYLLVGEGLLYMMGQWRSVFPRNPLARIAGTILMSIAVFGACGYHLNRYFLAWTQSPETKAIYSKKSS